MLKKSAHFKTQGIRTGFGGLTALSLVFSGCAVKTSSSTDVVSDGVASEIAATAISGAVSGGGTATMSYFQPASKKNWAERLASHVTDLVPNASAATWSCSGNGWAVNYPGPGGPYTYTSPSCSVTYGNGTSSSVTWDAGWKYTYGASCAAAAANKNLYLPRYQAANCVITRESQSGGNTRTITGPDGTSYKVVHDTTTSYSGYSTTITTSGAGIVMTCNSIGCASGSLVINGSHLTATTTVAGNLIPVWDHTVTTSAAGVSIQGVGSNTTISGAVTVQHNLAKYTSTATFSGVVYGDSSCCFPTAGTVTTAFTGGKFAGKSEVLTFSSTCGEASLTDSSGTQSAYTLKNCI